MSILQSLDFLIILNYEKEKIISQEILKEIKSRLGFLVNVGLDLFKFI